MALALHRVHEGLHLVNHELRQTETLQLPHSSPDVWVVPGGLRKEWQCGRVAEGSSSFLT